MSGPKVKKLKAQLAELQEELDSQGARNSRLFNDKKKLEVELKTVQGDLEEETNLRAKDVRLIAKIQKKLAFLSEEAEGGGGSAEELEKLKKKNKEIREALEEEEDKCAKLSTAKRRAVRDLDEKVRPCSGEWSRVAPV
jgi:chromosome segregation ATPase